MQTTRVSFLVGKMMSYFPMTPTTSQEKAMLALAMLVCSSKERPTLVVNGFAGTGKTVLMRSFCDMTSSEQINTVLLAPTGRAAKVLSSRTGRNAYTIHHLIYRQERQDNTMSFIPSYNRWKDTVFVVDEASMMGDSLISDHCVSTPTWGEGCLLSDLVDYVFSQSGSRLVLIGDPDQLPPVGLDAAPALDVEYLRSFGLTVGRVWLSDIVRQHDDSLILKNAFSLRTLIENKEEEFAYPALESFDGRDVESIESDMLIEKLEESYDKYGLFDTMIITRSNKRATLYSIGIRSQILNYGERIVRGDLFIVTRNNYLYGEQAGCGFIANGEIVEVITINGYSEMYGLHFADVSLRLVERDNSGFNCKIVLEMLTADVEGYEEETGLKRVLSMSDIQKMMDKGIEEDYAGYSNKRKKAIEIRNNQWYNALQVRYAYAVTCHKAQGGQWRNVFVDVGYVDEKQRGRSLAQWLYTALSRAKRKLYLINYNRDVSEW